MKTSSSSTLNAAVLVTLMAASFAAQAYDADWKRGRVYYRSVCRCTARSKPSSV